MNSLAQFFLVFSPTIYHPTITPFPSYLFLYALLEHNTSRSGQWIHQFPVMDQKKFPDMYNHLYCPLCMRFLETVHKNKNNNKNLSDTKRISFRFFFCYQPNNFSINECKSSNEKHVKCASHGKLMKM